MIVFFNHKFALTITTIIYLKVLSIFFIIKCNCIKLNLLFKLYLCNVQPSNEASDESFNRVVSLKEVVLKMLIKKSIQINIVLRIVISVNHT